MKAILSSIISAAFAVTISTAFGADESASKTVTLEGKAMCAKCELGTEKTCTSVLQVKEGDKTDTYYLSGKVDKKWHMNVCKAPKEAKMTGTVSEKDGKKWLDVTDIQLKEK
jgi:hypothetical protein